MNFLFLDTVGYESALRLSGHHYARLLVGRGHRVLSLSAPVTPFHRFSRRDPASIARRFENHRRGFTVAPGGVHHYVPHALFPVRNVFPLNRAWALRLAATTYQRDVARRLSAMRFVPDVVSLQNLMFYPLARRYSRALLHYRMEDLLEGFSDIPASILSCERKVLDEADLISITSAQFASKLTGANEPKTLYAPNAVELEFFAAPRPKPKAFEPIEDPIAVYIGAARDWFDWDLLKAVAEGMPKVHFVLVSPHAPRPDVESLANVTSIGGVAYEEIPAYYQHSAVCVIPFKASPLIDSVNPMKMYESLAAGTPVVAADWPELEKIGAPVARAKGAEEFRGAIERAIGRTRPIDYREFLENHSWDRNLNDLLQRIERRLEQRRAQEGPTDPEQPSRRRSFR